MLSRINRLKKRKEFNYVYKKGEVIYTPSLIIHYVKTYKPYTQIGISVSKQVGNSVIRSRVKRIISEACRHNLDKFVVKNYVITPKQCSRDKNSTDIANELISVFKKNGLLKG